MSVDVWVCLIIKSIQRKLTEWWEKKDILAKPVESLGGSILTFMCTNESKRVCLSQV